MSLQNLHRIPDPFGPAPLENPFDQELVYLLSGENREIETAISPVGKRMIRNGDPIDIDQVADAKPFSG